MPKRTLPRGFRNPSRRLAYAAFEKGRRNSRNILHLSYRIYGPTKNPFLPNDEEIARLVARLPRIRIIAIHRLPDHDYVLVRGLSKNVFASHADPEQREVRKAFKRDLTTLCTAARDVPPTIEQAYERLTTRFPWEGVRWTGEQVIGYSDGQAYQRRLLRPSLNVIADSRFQSLKHFEDICRSIEMAPFAYGTIPY